MTSKPISTEQAALEAFIHDRIEKHDVNVLLDYATYVEQELDSEPIRNLLLGILMTDSRVWGFLLAEAGTHNRAFAAALRDIGAFAEKKRAGFMEMSALAILAEAEGASK